MAKGRHRTRAEWQRLVELFEASGQTPGEFGAAHRISEATFRWWRSRLRDHAEKPMFLPVDVAVPSTPRMGRFEARLPSGVVLAFDDVDPAVLRELIAVLGSAR